MAALAQADLLLVDREELIAGLEVTTDPRIERYWQLTATINGWRRSRPACRETFGCSPRCPPTGDPAADGGVASQARRRLLPGLRAPARLRVA